MKKFLIIALTACVSACACFECDDDAPKVTTYQATRKAPLDCDYFDGKTCYHYVYKNVQRPVAQPAPIRQRPCETTAIQPACNCNCAPQPRCNDCNSGCSPKYQETREPVEVVYKRTTYKTVYEPKTTSEVSYEKVPYTSSVCSECVRGSAEVKTTQE